MKSIDPPHPTQQRVRSGVRLMVPGTLIFALVFLGLVPIPDWANASTEPQGGRDEVRLKLTADGFTPSEVQHAPGSFAIAVDNTTLTEEYTLRLTAEDGTVLNEIQVQKGSSAWTVNLQTGKYKLTEVNHSQWICSIAIQ